MGLEKSRVVDDGGQESRESPQQESGEELGNDGILGEGEKRKTSLWVNR